ncbi:YqgE/AlgH family protein [Sphingomicrobium lutaoense]|uniref:UPF0301 protein FHS50_000712 n=1 Tax=Sphingomicrobium lutaoense TaxID=515949 RepID=A0A839YWX5_9SPHN|nr:YqgE/AlgH family protein [Sphingomicrobium lutaoense]MBB3763689.1 putative transcriptional regulator [Sphingomicrobium lutaoense]
MEQAQFLTSQFLLAMPGMGDPRFEQAVIMMAAHDEDGALGIGVGSLLAGMTLRGLLKDLEIDPGEAPDVAIHHGGPVEPGRGFVLHSLDWAGQDSVQIGELCGLSGTLDVLKAIAAGKGPSQFLVALGYAGWEAGQLDEEMTRHGWQAAPASRELLFETGTGERWAESFKAQGIDPALLVGETGAA